MKLPFASEVDGRALDWFSVLTKDSSAYGAM